MIVSESISVSTDEAGFVHIKHAQMRDSGIDMGGPLWFERDNLPWVLDTLRACLSTYGFPGAEKQHGHDSLRVFESGPEQAPIVNLQNRRPKHLVHGGVYALLISRPVAQDLVARLAAL